MSKKAPVSVPVVVTVSDDHMPTIRMLAQRLRKHGLVVTNTERSIGIIAGTAAPGVIDALRREPGVSAVELEGGVQIAPPDAEVQ